MNQAAIFEVGREVESRGGTGQRRPPLASQRRRDGTVGSHWSFQVFQGPASCASNAESEWTPVLQIFAGVRKWILWVLKRSPENRTKPQESVLPICSSHPRQPAHHCGKDGWLMIGRSSKAWALITHFSWKCLRFHDPSLIPYAILSLYL